MTLILQLFIYEKSKYSNEFNRENVFDNIFPPFTDLYIGIF